MEGLLSVPAGAQEYVPVLLVEERLLLAPRIIEAGEADAVIVGTGYTVTDSVAVELQDPVVPITVYVVLVTGLTV